MAAPAQRMKITRSGARTAILCALCVITCCVSAGTLTFAQTGQTAQYHVYQLLHKDAAQVEGMLRNLLPGLGTTTELVVDRQHNKILLRGPEQAQQVATQLIRSVDRPIVIPDDAPSVLRSYSLPADRLQAFVTELTGRYGQTSGVRIATDPTTSQLIILAPPSIQTIIARQITGTSSGVQPPGPVRTGQQPPPVVERFVRLTHFRVDVLQTRIRQLFGARLRPASEVPGAATFELLVRSPQSAHLTFDERRGGVLVVASQKLANQLARLVEMLDLPPRVAGSTIRVLPLKQTDPAKVQRAVEAYRGHLRPFDPTGESVPDGAVQGTSPKRVPPPDGTSRSNRRGNGIDLVGYVFQDPAAAQDEPAPGTPGGQAERLRQLAAEVEIEALPDLDVIILRGRERDVEEITRIIAELERISAETEPAIDIYYLKHVAGESVSELISQVQEDYLGGRQGRVSIIPLVKPNALLLIGWGEAVTAAKKLISKLDQPVSVNTQFRMFRLRFATAATVATTLEQFFQGRDGGLGPQVQITPDSRTNSLAVHASPRDMAEVEILVTRLDVDTSGVVAQTRIFPVHNSLATDLAETLQETLDTARAGGTGDKSAILELLTVDAEGERLVKSGLLDDVTVNANPRTNTLIVTAPPDSMNLLSALIQQLDAPGMVAQIKVFRIINGDAGNLVAMLESLLPTQSDSAVGPQLPTAEDESSFAPLRFSVDIRTKSIIASGSAGDLKIVQALLMYLDNDDVIQRENTVYHLRNAPALYVANAVNDFLRSERQVQQAVPGASNPFQQIESEVVVVPEVISNSLIISATPRFYEEIIDIVEDLDKQPAQVVIQVLIAEVDLTDQDEFGVELGFQDSILFDRSLLSELLTTTRTTTSSTPSGIVTLTEDIIQAATNTPGFNFNSADPLGNSGSTQSLSRSNRIGTQGMSSFALGRNNEELGFGGMVLSVSSESLSLLIRSLQEKRKIEVLSRPQIRTLDNQPAYIQVGQRVPRIVGSTTNQVGQSNAVELENVGLILGVTPRIGPDGMVVMEVDAEKSELGKEIDGIPVAVSREGIIIRSPRIDTTTAQTSVAAANGETIVLGGLIVRNSTDISRRVPVLADIPLLGNLFRYDAVSVRRSELLVILTPHVIMDPEDDARIKQLEIAKMNWCLSDVHEIYGPLGDPSDYTLYEEQTPTIFPDHNPRGEIPHGSEDGFSPPHEIPPPVRLQHVPADSSVLPASGHRQPSLRPLPSSQPPFGPGH